MADRPIADYGKTKRQEIRMLNRKTLEITGVLSVESFDSEQFTLETECGFLKVKGQNLHMKSLTLEQGSVAIEGYVSELAYVETGAQKSKGLFAKLFK